MDIQSIPIITVSYNAPDLIAELLGTLRLYYGNKVYVIDGSEEKYAKAIGDVVEQYDNTEFIHFDYNIHHGPGMAWAINNLNLSGRVLVIDSDVSVLRGGFIESLASELKPFMYGVGQLNYVNRGGFDMSGSEVEGALLYLHPALMLCNIKVIKQWPMPVKHGAPMIEAMTALHDTGNSNLLGHVDWVRADFAKDGASNFIRHDWQGTVRRTGGYHLEEWQRSVVQTEQERLHQNAAERNYIRDMLKLIPVNAHRVIEVGCGNGALAQAYKLVNPDCRYIGVDVDSGAANQAHACCDEVLNLDIESVDDDFFKSYSNTDIWIFRDLLDCLVDPWKVLAKVRANLPVGGSVVASLPNAQHWMIQAKLCVGDFRYDNSGLLDRTQLHLFTRATMFELFQSAGFKIEQGFPRITGELSNSNIVAAIKLMAFSVGADPELALQDALPLQYLVKAVPV